MKASFLKHNRKCLSWKISQEWPCSREPGITPLLFGLPSISYELPAALFAIVKAQRIILRDKNTGALFPGSIAIYNVP